MYDVGNVGWQVLISPAGPRGMNESAWSATQLGGHDGSASMSLSGRALLSAWLISLLVHLAGLAGMFFLVFPFTGQESEAEALSPMVQLVGPLNASGQIRSDLSELSQQAPSEDAWEIKFAPKPAAEALAAAPPQKPELSIIGIGTGGGEFDDFGLGLGGDAAPDFFGVGQAARGARRIVYVVDRSGSMIDTFEFVRRELKRSIGSLRRSQKFHVIFFNSRAPLEAPPKRLVNAVEAHTEPFFEFLDQVVPTGGTEPETALNRALQLRPDLIYLLSDGIDFEAGLLTKLNEWNRDRKARIFTIAYLDRTGREILEIIAREHGGEFKFVSEYDLP